MKRPSRFQFPALERRRTDQSGCNGDGAGATAGDAPRPQTIALGRRHTDSPRGKRNRASFHELVSPFLTVFKQIVFAAGRHCLSTGIFRDQQQHPPQSAVCRHTRTGSAKPRGTGCTHTHARTGFSGEQRTLRTRARSGNVGERLRTAAGAAGAAGTAPAAPCTPPPRRMNDNNGRRSTRPQPNMNHCMGAAPPDCSRMIVGLSAVGASVRVKSRVTRA
ncbi:unnamed protein product [Leptosia nina]|uniref:Uncharacterized protein n=1 Tax=Leptosia nina TaxID=320188 RepID=A0AAV1JSJ5_9NEOP